MSSGSKSKTSRFKAFISRGSGGSSIPSTSSAPNSPPTNYKNLKYVKDSITKSTSNMSISSHHLSLSNKMHASTTTTTTTANEIELNTKRRFESLKSYTVDSFNNNNNSDRNSNAKTNSSISSREGSVLSDKFTSKFQTNLPAICVKIPYQESVLTSSTRSECPSPNLSIASSSSQLVNGPFAQTFPQKKRNTVYEVSSKWIILRKFGVKSGSVVDCGR